MSVSDTGTNVYRKLQQHLDEKMPVGFPPTKSGVEIRILKFLFSPKEAQIAAELSPEYETVQNIFPRVKGIGLTVMELEKTLDKMVSNGAINVKTVGDKRKYANAIFAIGMYENQLKRLTAEFYKDFNQYVMEAFGLEYMSTKVSQFRTLPVELSITPQHYVPRYEELQKLIEDTDGPFGVAECICRKGQALIGKPCKKTSRTETCITGPVAAELYKETGRGRIITKEEALEILRKNEEDGLVHQASNTEGLEWICSCCGCCCASLQGYKLMPVPVEYVSSNYYAQSDAELCSGCGTCKDRCQMNAVKLINDVSTVSLQRCIGCGLCVATCPEKAMHLVKKDKHVEPPKTLDDLYANIMNKKNEIRQKSIQAR